MSSIADAIRQVFSSNGFIPRRIGGMWSDWLVWEHVTGNALIWIAYIALPALIWRLGSRSVDWTPFKGLIRAFACFVALCGLSHFLGMVAFVYPFYRLSGHVLVLTGLVSWCTVLSLRRAWPALIALKNPVELEPMIAERTAGLATALDKVGRVEYERAYLATIVDSSQDAIVGKDLNGVITSWNAGAERLFGYTADEAMGRPITFLIPPDRQNEESIILERLRRGESVNHFETRRLTKNGRAIDVSLAISPIKDRSGRIVGISKIARDISERARVDESLRQGEENFRQLADSIPQLTWMARADGHMFWYNRRWYDYTGTTPEQMEGWGWQSVHDPDVLPLVLDRWHASIADGEPFEMVFPLRGADGQFRNFLTRIFPSRDLDGRVVHWFGTNTDIDEQTRAEARIKASERLYRAIGESIPFGVWSRDREGRNTYASDSFLQLVGLTQEQCSQFGLGAVLHPEDTERISAAWNECVRTEGNWDVEHRVLGTDGQWHPILSRGVPVRDDSGRIISWAGINLDISRLKRTEEALRASEGRQRLAMTAARIAHWEYDVQADRLRYQDSLSLLYDRPDNRAFSDLSDFLTIVHPDDRASVRAAAEGALVPGVPYEVEYRIILSDGSVRWLAGRGATFFGDDGTPLRMVGINLDITQSKASELQIRVLNEGLEQRVRERTAEIGQQVRLIDMADDAIIVRSREGMISFWNEGAERLYGWTKEEVLGRTSHEILKTQFPRPLAEILHELATRGLWDGELIHESREGVRIVVASRWVVDRDRSVDAAVLEINTDITERKASEEALRRARDDALAATTVKGEFLANMSHEIRTPMNGVIGMTDLLLDTQLNDFQFSYAETIRSSGEALLTVINDILDFSKIDAGKLKIDPTDFDPRTLIKEVIDLLAPRAQQKRLEIACRVSPDVPDSLYGDAVRIRQVLTNLVGNAVKFTESGAVDLELRLLAEDENHVTVRIEVRDTGIGIPADSQANIFESFTQVEGGNSRQYGGTGLGLTICRSLIALMGGRIGVESRFGSGSTFWFELQLGKGSGTTSLPAANLRGLRVLIVDDHETNRRILAEMIQSWECQPETAGSAAGALARLLANPDSDPFDLIMIDQKMPGMNGEQAARVIRAIPRYAKVPLVLLTSLDSPVEPKEGEQHLFVTQITKPVKRSQLYNAIRRAATAHGSVLARAPVDARETVLATCPRILLAEDNNVNRRVAIGMLERLGCRVETVHNGRAAVESLDYDRHDILLMDVQMPEMDGLSATVVIRAREKTTGLHIPIIAMTAHAMQGDRERCLAAGMDGYISKPLRPALLREALISFAVDDSHPAGAVVIPSVTGARFDFADSLRESCGEDPSAISEVVGMLLKDVPEGLKRLEVAVTGKDGRRVSWEAHSLKGAFMVVGAEALASACQELIKLGELAEFSSIESIYSAIPNEWNVLRSEAVRHLETLALGRVDNS